MDGMKPEGMHPGTEWCRRRILRRVAIERLRMRAVFTGWRPRAGKIRDDKEQIIVAPAAAGERAIALRLP